LPSRKSVDIAKKFGIPGIGATSLPDERNGAI